VNKSKYRRKPYAPFTTSSLQQEASSKLGYSTKKTMGVAQSLYEGVKIKGDGTTGLITYMRTDSTRISDVAKDNVAQYIEDNFDKKYLRTSKKKKSKSKNVQDAHEAIRPTSVFRTPEKMKSSLNKDQYNLYTLIWKRFVASQMANAIFDRIKIKINNGKYLLTTSGQVIKFDGFLKVYTYVNTTEKRLPNLSEDEVLEDIKYDPSEHQTQPPARYTEASLVKTMEKLGIGRPSTYSPTISTILSRGYIEKEGRYLKPTELGILINGILSGHFEDIVDVNFTADMEEEFDEIEEGNLEWKEIIKEFYGPFAEVLESADKNIEKVDLTEETDEVCEKCGSPMVIKHGRYGKFMACSNYPECKNTKPVLNKIGIDCPNCEDGEIVVRKSRKKNRTFYGCSNYPKCKFVSWDKPIEEKCPKCGSILTERKNKTKKKIKCSNDECDYKREEKL
jgi:DNA topoisomerase-1